MPSFTQADDTVIASLGFPSAQALLSRGSPETLVLATCGWHGTLVDPQLGSFALVRTGGPLADYVGERVKITYSENARDKVVYAYVYAEADIVEDITVTRSLFARLTSLATGSVGVRVEIMVGGEDPTDVTGEVPVDPSVALREPSNYVPADPREMRPSSMLTVLGGGGYNLQSRLNYAGGEGAYTYGQLYLPSLGLGNDFEITQKWFTGANSLGNLRPFGTGNDQRQDLIFGCSGRYKPWAGVGKRTTLGAPLFFDGTAGVPLPVVSTADFPTSGVVRLVSGNNLMTVIYDSITGNTFLGTSEHGDYVEGTFDYNWPADTVVQAIVDVADQTTSWNVLGFFGYWNISEGGFGVTYADYAVAPGWQDFGGVGGGPDSAATDGIFVDVGRLGMQTVLSEDWTADVSLYAGGTGPGIDIGLIPVVDSSVFPDSTFMTTGSSDFQCRIFEGAPRDIYASGGTNKYITVESYLKPDTGHLHGSYRGDSRLDGGVTGTTHTFAAGTPVVVPAWSGTPLLDGLTLDLTDGSTQTDFFFNECPVGTGSFAPGTDTRYMAVNSHAWTKLRCVGNEITWELWKEDPHLPGSTYAIRMRVVLTSPDGIAKLGAAMPSCMFGPMGWYEAISGSKLEDWSFEIL